MRRKLPVGESGLRVTVETERFVAHSDETSRSDLVEFLCRDSRVEMHSVAIQTDCRLGLNQQIVCNSAVIAASI